MGGRGKGKNLHENLLSPPLCVIRNRMPKMNNFNLEACSQVVSSLAGKQIPRPSSPVPLPLEVQLSLGALGGRASDSHWVTKKHLRTCRKGLSHFAKGKLRTISLVRRWINPANAGNTKDQSWSREDSAADVARVPTFVSPRSRVHAPQQKPPK